MTIYAIERLRDITPVIGGPMTSLVVTFMSVHCLRRVFNHIYGNTIRIHWSPSSKLGYLSFKYHITLVCSHYSQQGGDLEEVLQQLSSLDAAKQPSSASKRLGNGEQGE